MVQCVNFEKYLRNITELLGLELLFSLTSPIYEIFHCFYLLPSVGLQLDNNNYCY